VEVVLIPAMNMDNASGVVVYVIYVVGDYSALFAEL